MAGHWPEPIFPKGPLFVSREAEPVFGKSHPVEQTWVKYINAPLLRTKSLEKQYVSAVRRIISHSGDRVLAVVSYNAYSAGRKIKEEVLRGTHIPWVPIIADADGSSDGRERLFRETASADAAIILSWGLAEGWRTCPVLHLDGGVEKNRIWNNKSVLPCECAVYPFLYCGATNKWAGVDLLAEAFAGWPEPRARLWLCGKVAIPKRFPELTNDQRVTCFGAVSDDEFDELAAQCYALVNPRRTDLSDNQMNFPSKVLEYLRYGKPVVSTWTDGLDPVYRSLLTVAIEGTAPSLRDAMVKTMTWTEDALKNHREATRHFLFGSRTWEQQAQRLRDFMVEIHRGVGRR
jgi:glycosyltransferase involved in cell wall biosynthesis